MKHYLILSIAIYSIQVNAGIIETSELAADVNVRDFRIENNCSASEQGQKVHISQDFILIPDQNKVTTFYKSVLIKLQSMLRTSPGLSYQTLMRYDKELRPLYHHSFFSKLKKDFNYDQDCTEKAAKFIDSKHNLHFKLTKDDLGYSYDCYRRCIQSLGYSVETIFTSILKDGSVIKNNVRTLGSAKVWLEVENAFCKDVEFRECPTWD